MCSTRHMCMTAAHIALSEHHVIDSYIVWARQHSSARKVTRTHSNRCKRGQQLSAALRRWARSGTAVVLAVARSAAFSVVSAQVSYRSGIASSV
jgi:GTP cyclohydrolase II